MLCWVAFCARVLVTIGLFLGVLDGLFLAFGVSVLFGVQGVSALALRLYARPQHAHYLGAWTRKALGTQSECG